MRKLYFRDRWLSISLSALLLFSTNCRALEPVATLSPAEVVKFQLQSLRTDIQGDGIAATFRFASPANKEFTGPLSRFTRLFEHVQYKPMINHISAEIIDTTINDTTAELITQLVDQQGAVNYYLFQLSRQNSGEHINCWMTDAVIWQPGPGSGA